MTAANGKAPETLFAALAAFQADLPKVGKGATAQYGKYADLADVSREVLPRLGALGLTFTARPTMVDGTFALACLFLIGWVHAALDTPLSLSRIMLAIDFLPFCALFFLIAFYNALINFQIRSGRRATWREYLLTDRGFLPQ